MDELIRRQELSDEIQRIYDKHYTEANSQTVHDIFHAVLKRIDKAKAVDAAPIVHGHWDNDAGFDRCSICGGLELGQTKYCPNCGALMDKMENNND